MSIASRDILSIAAAPDPTDATSLRDVARGRRIVLLIVALILMSLTDLGCTLTYLTSFGMIESNPIARHMIDIGGIRQLVLYKAFTMSVSCGCIFLIRKKRGAEFGAWICVVLLLFLMFHWLQYNDVMQALSAHFTTGGLPPSHASACDGWILISE